MWNVANHVAYSWSQKVDPFLLKNEPHYLTTLSGYNYCCTVMEEFRNFHKFGSLESTGHFKSFIRNSMINVFSFVDIKL